MKPAFLKTPLTRTVLEFPVRVQVSWVIMHVKVKKKSNCTQIKILGVVMDNVGGGIGKWSQNTSFFSIFTKFKTERESAGEIYANK